jgi:hypothetical protein
MRVLGGIEIHALVCGALHANRIDAWNIKSPAQPSCQVLIRRLPNRFIQRLIVKRGNGSSQTRPQPIDFIARKCSPLVRQFRTHFRDKAVAVESPGTMSVRENSDTTRRFEWYCGCK